MLRNTIYYKGSFERIAEDIKNNLHFFKKDNFPPPKIPRVDL